MIGKRIPRRVTGGVLVLAGATIMWLAPETLAGAWLLAAGIALEAVGLVLERRAAQSGRGSHAVE